MNLRHIFFTFLLVLVGSSLNAQSTYYHNQLDGPALETGMARLQDSGELVTGRVITKYDSGQLRLEGFYVAGKKEGAFRWWYASGQLGSEENYLNDLKHGVCRQWHANGQLKQEAQYQNGKQKGRTKYWDKNGAKRKIKRANR